MVENEKITDSCDQSKKVPVWEKLLLTVKEAAAYTGLGEHKIKKLTEDEDCPFVLWNGSKRMIKRQAMEAYLNNSYSI